MKSWFKENGWLYLLSAVLFATVSPLITDTGADNDPVAFVRAFFTGAAHWSYFPVLPWFAYVLIGMSFRVFMKNNQFSDFLSKEHIWIFVMPLVIILLFTFNWGSEITHTLEGKGGYYHHGFLFFVWVTAFIAVYSILIHLMDIKMAGNSGSRFLQWLGRHVTLVYIVQWIIIGNLATDFYRSQGLFSSLTWFVAIFLMTILISWLILKFSHLIRPFSLQPL
jgi:fucose 4-O-acetylase-like acetyltransferase